MNTFPGIIHGKSLMTYSFTDTELELLKDALGEAIQGEEDIASGFVSVARLDKEDKKLLQVSGKWLLGWYKLQEKFGVIPEPDKEAMKAISHALPVRCGRPTVEIPNTLTLYQIKRGFFDGLGINDIATKHGVGLLDIYHFLEQKGLNHKAYKYRYKALNFLWTLRKAKVLTYVQFAKHRKVSRQCVQDRAMYYGIDKQAQKMFRRRRKDPNTPPKGPGVASYLKGGQEILVYGKDLIGLWKRKKACHDFKVIKTCDNPRLEWFRLRFTEPMRYRLEGETATTFPGITRHPNGSWHANFARFYHFGYYKEQKNAIDALQEFILTGKTSKHRRGRKKLSIDIDKLRDLCSKKLYLSEIADDLGVSLNTACRYIKQFNIKRDKF